VYPDRAAPGPGPPPLPLPPLLLPPPLPEPEKNGPEAPLLGSPLAAAT
jgi:hypothetical protein